MEKALELASREQDGPLPETPSKLSQMYAGFGQRLFAAVIDCVLLFVLLFFSFIYLITAPGIFGREWTSIVIFVLFWLVMSWGYFAGLESSSLQGTLGKAAVGIVVTQSRGKKVGFWRATGNFALRALSFGIVLGLLVFGAVLFVAGAAIIGGGSVPPLSGGTVLLLLLGILVSLAVILVPSAVTPRRQSVHNLITGTLVVRRDYVPLVAKLAEPKPSQPFPPPPSPTYTGAYGTDAPS
ncbi:MAG: RDD family protein [Candidatus Dormibacteraeota bacterium]|nr:RDD family protein [Candidatus Dormibacteraeota bacterium]